MKHLNNKGYMLVEIILAFVLAMTLAYFITDLTIKLKNKNDDLLVKTLVAADQAIIYNTIMRDIYNSSDGFSCEKLSVDDNKFTYNGFTHIISDYATIGDDSCSGKGDNFILRIPLSVKQLPDDDFSININYEDGNFVYNMPSCKLSVTGTVINAQITDSGNGIVYNGWNSNMIDGHGNISKNITDIGTYTYYLKDSDNNQGSCSLKVIKTTKNTVVNETYTATYVGNKSDGCTCQKTGLAGYTFGICGEDDGICSCAEGLKIRTDRCYVCNTGDTLNKKTCTNYGTQYSCSSGYTKINNSYCYKLN